MNRSNLYIFLAIFSLSIFAQDKEEIPIDEQRDNKIKALLEIVKKIRGFEIEKKVGVLSGAPVCSKTQKFLNENNITIKSL